MKAKAAKKVLAAAMATALVCTAPIYAEEISGNISNQEFSSSTDGENAIHVDGESATMDNIEVTKTGDSSSEDADFYGENAAILAENGATVTITDAEIETDGKHANAVFSYGEGTTVNISDSTITTYGNNSGGLMTTGGGTMNAENLDVQTYGNSSAAIRSDRGGGTVNVDGGTYETSGVGSPVIYSTADITVSNAELTSNKSEAIVIEGGNSVELIDCVVDGNNTTANGQSTNLQNVFIYQSMSGDASEGTSVFKMTGGSMTCESGDMFYVTNTTTNITLENVDLTYSADGQLLKIQADAWGTSGANGGNVTFTAVDQELEGTITVDDISTLNLILTENSEYTGSINSDGEAGEVYVEIQDGSTWTLTDDSYISSLTCSEDAIILNGNVLYVNGVAYVLGTTVSGEAVSDTTSSSSSSSSSDSGRPSGNGSSSDSSRPEMPSGESGQQTPPEMPSGESGQQTPPEKPSGESDQQTPPEMPSGESGQQTPPEMPSGESGQQTPPEMPSGEMTQPSEQPEVPTEEQNVQPSEQPEVPAEEQNAQPSEQPEVPAEEQNVQPSEQPEIPAEQAVVADENTQPTQSAQTAQNSASSSTAKKSSQKDGFSFYVELIRLILQALGSKMSTGFLTFIQGFAI